MQPVQTPDDPKARLVEMSDRSLCQRLADLLDDRDETRAGTLLGFVEHAGRERSVEEIGKELGNALVRQG